MTSLGRTAVLLFNLGGPESLDAVEPFLYNLFSDQDIMAFPPVLRTLLPRLITMKRAPTSRAYYRAIGGGSPLRAITDRQARALESALNEGVPETDPPPFRVFVAMRYAPPRMAELVEEMRSYAPKKVVLLPLYPQRSTTTTRSSFREFLEIARSRLSLSDDALRVIAAYPAFPPYLAALAETVQTALDRIPPDEEPVDILYSAHGIPEARVRKGDPYQLDTETTVREVSALLGPHNPGRTLRTHLAYQSRVGPMKWLGPETKETIRTLAGSGCRTLVLVPVSFVSDHQETLYEMDITYRKLARDVAIRTFERAPAINLLPSFTEALRALVFEALAGQCPTSQPCNCRCGACPAP